MRVIISLTSIPSRFDKLPIILKNLCVQTCHEVWLNIPKSYSRFPEWDGEIPSDLINFDPKLVVNQDCEDLGPGTKVLAPAYKLDREDLIVYLDDDTNFDPKLVMNLLKWHKVDPQSAWGMSGFNFEPYFQGHYPRQHGAFHDVIEGYGSVIVKAGWIQDITEEFKELKVDARFADDIILSNLLTKHGVGLRTVCTPECNIGIIQQYSFGFDKDALHNQTTGGHAASYHQVLKSLEDKGKSYFKHKCS